MVTHEKLELRYSGMKFWTLSEATDIDVNFDTQAIPHFLISSVFKLPLPFLSCEVL